MCRLPSLFSVMAVLVMAVTNPAVARADDTPVYELRVYTCEPGKLDALHERFEDHTMQIFEKHGMENVAYWVPTDEPKSGNTLIYLLKHESRAAAKASWMAFLNDPDWKQVAQASREKHGKILAKAPESTYLIPTDYSKEVALLNKEGLYELRLYKTADGKLGDLHKRFREHTDHILPKWG